MSASKKLNDRLPNSRIARIIIGVLLVIMGIFGFLPIIGFWMIPVGLLVLSIEDLLGTKNLGQVHEIIYNSSLDGVEIQGWYLTPPDFDPAKKYPLILEIHGGPHASYGPNFAAELQRFAAEVYVV